MGDFESNACMVINTVVYLLLFALCVLAILSIFDSIILRILLIVISFLACGFIEERLLSRFVNAFVEKIDKSRKK